MIALSRFRTVADAERAVAWCRYPPDGLRGIAVLLVLWEHLGRADHGINATLKILKYQLRLRFGCTG